MKLRPIKTAPRDGTPILIWCSCADWPFIGYWGNPFAFVKKDKQAWVGHEYGLHEDSDVIGWRPLPGSPR
jgi:hypothetical protein